MRRQAPVSLGRSVQADPGERKDPEIIQDDRIVYKTMNEEHRRISHIMILATYTGLITALVGETLLMSWELWAIPLLIAGVVLSWLVHIRQRMNENQRLWVYTVLMIGSFFFYGIHPTSTYDMGLLIMAVMLVYTLTGQAAMVTAYEAAYYVTLAIDLFQMTREGAVWDGLLISRTILHIIMIFVAGLLARAIIRQWDQLFSESGKQIESLDRTARRMNGFLANLSHELRTPVNAILGISDKLYEKEHDPDDRADLRTLYNAGSRMALQIGDIMDYSELENGRIRVQEETYDTASLFNDIVSELRPYVPDEIEIVIDIDADIPASMISDTAKLKKILFHIIMNSLKFTKEGGVYVHASAIRQKYGVNLAVRVTDTGIGMTAEELEQITDRFYQAKSGKKLRTGGLGLGIYIVYGLVSALGGFMTIESTEGEGTTVRISIPQKVADERPCMGIGDPEKLSIGGYINIAKYSDPNVREYYNAMILNVTSGLGVKMHWVSSMEEFRELTRQVRLTHIFVGEEEYLTDPAYIESLADNAAVILVAHSDDVLGDASRLRFIRKPLYSLSIAHELITAPEAAAVIGRRMVYRGIKALVVDDEPMNLRVASSILQKYEMEVEHASSGREALKLVREKHFDIIFMDHMMPEMDGIETMKAIRQDMGPGEKGVPIVALTANALSSAREKFITEGFDGFVSKPIERQELERVMRRLLPGSALSWVETEGKSRAELRSSGVRTDEETEGKSRADAGRSLDMDKDAEVKSVSGSSDAGGPASVIGRLESSGIDVKSGLRYTGEDEGFYVSVLSQFADEQSRKAGQLDSFLKDEKYKDYAILAHSLKSSARMIGAGELSETAKGLERAAKEAAAEKDQDPSKAQDGNTRKSGAGDLTGSERASEASGPDDQARYVAEKHSKLIKEYAETARLIREALPEGEADASGADNAEEQLEDEVMEFAPEEQTEDEVMEFAPEEQGTESGRPDQGADEDGALEFAPEGDD